MGGGGGDKIFKFTPSRKLYKHKAYLYIDLISVYDFLSSATVRHVGKMGDTHQNNDKNIVTTTDMFKVDSISKRRLSCSQLVFASHSFALNRNFFPLSCRLQPK